MAAGAPHYQNPYETRSIVIDEMQLQLKNSILYQVELIKFCYENFPEEINQRKVAIAVDPKYKDLSEFWNLYGANRGFPWKGFTSLAEALEWIRQDEIRAHDNFTEKP